MFCNNFFHFQLNETNFLCSFWIEMCRNNGKCVEDNINGVRLCECENGYTGLLCEQVIPLEAQVDILFVTVTSMICLLIMALLIMSLWFIRSVKKARATRGTYSPSAQEMFGNSAIEIIKPPPEERLI